jgi:hypothetical protein
MFHFYKPVLRLLPFTGSCAERVLSCLPFIESHPQLRLRRAVSAKLNTHRNNSSISPLSARLGEDGLQLKSVGLQHELIKLQVYRLFLQLKSVGLQPN